MKAPSTIFRGFRERILCVRVLIGLVDYFRFCGLFLGVTNVSMDWLGKRISCLGFAWFFMEILWFGVDY